MCYVHDSPIHGQGLIAARDLPARASLGELVGERITAAEFAKRKAAGGACLVRFTDLDGAEVHLDGEGRCLVAHVNSVQGTGLLPNCEFVSDGQSYVTAEFAPPSSSWRVTPPSATCASTVLLYHRKPI